MILHQIQNSRSIRSYNARIYEDLCWQPHFHRNYEAVYIYEGEVEASLGGKTVTLRAGEYALCLSNEVHHYTTAGYSRAWIGVFSGDYVPEFEKTVRGKTGESCVFRCGEGVQRFLEQNLLVAGEPDAYMLTACLYLLCGEYLQKVPLRQRGEKESTLMNDAVDYISENYRRKLTLSDAAKALGYDYSYFSKLFHSVFGVCFSDYLNTFRFNAAAEALLTTDDSVTSIALESGFQSIRSFNDVFRRKSGMTPAQYRQNRGA